MIEPTDKMTPEQESRIQYLNDTWGVDTWELDPSDGEVKATLDDGDVVTIVRDGNWWLD